MKTGLETLFDFLAFWYGFASGCRQKLNPCFRFSSMIFSINFNGFCVCRQHLDTLIICNFLELSDYSFLPLIHLHLNNELL